MRIRVAGAVCAVNSAKFWGARTFSAEVYPFRDICVGVPYLRDKYVEHGTYMKSAFFAENVVPVCEKGQTSSTDGRKGSCPYLWVNSTSTYCKNLHWTFYLQRPSRGAPPGGAYAQTAYSGHLRADSRKLGLRSFVNAESYL